MGGPGGEQGVDGRSYHCGIEGIDGKAGDGRGCTASRGRGAGVRVDHDGAAPDANADVGLKGVAAEVDAACADGAVAVEGVSAGMAGSGGAVGGLVGQNSQKWQQKRLISGKLM